MSDKGGCGIYDYSAIREGIKTIYTTPSVGSGLLRCPRLEHKFLHDCLTESAQCPKECIFRDKWTGPDKKETATVDSSCD
jgi:hypothetical protein